MGNGERVIRKGRGEGTGERGKGIKGKEGRQEDSGEIGKREGKGRGRTVFASFKIKSWVRPMVTHIIDRHNTETFRMLLRAKQQY